MLKSVLPASSEARKAVPLATGVLDYFPAALAAVARLSKAGNDKHNPGQPLHWSRGKSNDHADTILRHLVDRGTIDAEDGIRHSVKVAWRALALLQEELEYQEGATPGRGSVFPPENMKALPEDKMWTSVHMPGGGEYRSPASDVLSKLSVRPR